MAVHVDFVVDGGEHRAVPVDDEGPAAVGRPDLALCVESRPDDPVGVGQQGEPEFVQLVELTLLIHLISADPHYPGFDRLEFGLEVPEVATFPGSALGLRLRIEVQNQPAVFEQFVQRDLRTELVEGGKRLHLVAWFHGHTVARVLERGARPLPRRPDVDPPQIPRADVEIDIDMENVLDGVYLWGALVTDRTETGLVDTGYRAFATWDPLTTDTESENFLHFWDWLDTLITSCTRAGASMLAYCWHQAAENTQLRRIARHSPTLKPRVDSFISSGEWVDLKRIFKAGWITGGSTGLKAIAPLAGFSWDIDNPGGAIAMVRYTEASAGGQVDCPDFPVPVIRCS